MLSYTDTLQDNDSNNNKSPTQSHDPTGAKCAINQNDPNVWYLARTFGLKLQLKNLQKRYRVS